MDPVEIEPRLVPSLPLERQRSAHEGNADAAEEIEEKGGGGEGGKERFVFR